MAAIVVPFRGAAAKRRLSALPPGPREALALAMLADVLRAAVETAATSLVTDDDRARRVAREAGADVIDDPGGGQNAAVSAAVSQVRVRPVAVVNADLPCISAEDLRELLAAVPPHGVALAPASDGTTNALALSSPDLFEPLYGPGSADRFCRHARRAVTVDNANLADDVDTLADLERVERRAGRHTRAALALLVGAPA